MEKYLKRLCRAILMNRFNDEKHRSKKLWHGHEVQTQPLFCSYGKIGFEVAVYKDGLHFCTIEWDWDMSILSIDDVPWKEYIKNYL